MAFLVGSCFVLIGIWMIFRKIEEQPKVAAAPVKTVLPRA
jgi:hypothetical protein